MASLDNCRPLWNHKLESFKVDANTAIRFKLIRDESDLSEENGKIFHPEMTHQIFGENEIIFGYKGLSIDIFYTAAKMVTYVGVKYLEEINPKKFDGIKADDFLKMLAEYLPKGFVTNLDVFTKSVLGDAAFKPFGERICCYCNSGRGKSVFGDFEDEKGRRFEIYRVTKPTSDFVEYHERLQPFLIFFVDAASYVDTNDSRWEYHLIYEKYVNSDNRECYAFVGYMTVYNFFAYPDKIRPRISQVIILPPYQSQGHGTKLLETFYQQCWDDGNVLDISVEDPSEPFQRLRDFVDARNLSKYPEFQRQLLHQGYNESMAKVAATKLKISKMQARRVYEILRLKVTNCFDEKEFKAYRVDVKRRLNIPFKKDRRNMDRLCKVLKPTELAAALVSVSDETRIDLLDQQFKVCLEEYRMVIKRLECC